tara:strand:+ start:58 stop:606 length:549 start_codon:yes stop_codon:yes gene_type:complete
MKIAKYIFPISTILIAALGMLSFVDLDSPTFILAISLGMCALLSTLEKLYIKKQKTQKKIIEITHKKKSIINTIFNISFIVGLMALNLFLFPKKEVNPIDTILIIGNLTSIFSLTLFTKDIAFYIDKSGLIQPELLNKDIAWRELKNLDISEEIISFNYQGKSYSFAITPENYSLVKTWYNT